MKKITLSSKDQLDNLKNFAGGKATNLARLVQANFPVPDWFCLSAVAMEQIISLNGPFPLLPTSITPKTLQDYSQQVEEFFLQVTFPHHVMSELDLLLSSPIYATAFVAVRSSGLDEDSPQFSFAGQFSSFLYQKGREQILLSIRKCWASAYSERALSYRLENNLPLANLKMGVIIQRMLHPTVSGVGFSRNVINPLDRDNLLISAAWGTGEGIVSGAVDTDEFKINRNSLSIEAKITTKLQAMVQKADGGVQLQDNPLDLHHRPALSDQQIRELAGIIIQLEEIWQVPQDCEWAIEENKLYLLQTRPITSLPPNAFYSTTINGGHDALWDNSNIIESYSGVTTPLTFSFASFAYRQVYLQFHQLMGVPAQIMEQEESMYRNFLGLIRGRIYYNLVNWYKLVLLLPGAAQNASFMETMMGVKQSLKPEVAKLFSFIQHPPRYSIWRKIFVHGKTLYRFLQIKKISQKFKADIGKIYQEAMTTNFRQQSLGELATYYHFLETEVLKKWQAPIINDYLCMIFFGLLKKLTLKWIGEDAGSFQNDLLCGEGNLESTEPTKYLMKLAAQIDHGDPEFRQWFLSSDLTTLKNSNLVKKLLHDFIYRYGFRCADELKLESQDLHDDPSFAISAIISFLQLKNYSIVEMEERERQIRQQAEAKMFSRLTSWKLFIYQFVLKHTRYAVKNREDLRFLRTKVFGICRQLFRAMGQHFHQLTVLAAPNDIFFLTTEEIIAFIEGRSVSSNFHLLVAQRQSEFQKYAQTLTPPDRFLSHGAATCFFNYPQILALSDLLAKDRKISADPNCLLGTPCCPGMVEGLARVVSHPADAHGLNQEILVTHRTDPGWVPLYPACKGIIIERGSLLSHSAVVARELGIPTIVGVDGNLLARLKTGDPIKMDGQKGEIYLLPGSSSYVAQ